MLKTKIWREKNLEKKNFFLNLKKKKMLENFFFFKFEKKMFEKNFFFLIWKKMLEKNISRKNFAKKMYNKINQCEPIFCLVSTPWQELLKRRSNQRICSCALDIDSK